MTTVFQGLISAGPGWLKASQYAIGPWSEIKSRKFRWIELRFRTTAVVPYIDHEAFINLINLKVSGNYFHVENIV